MGPIAGGDISALPYSSQYLINVRRPGRGRRAITRLPSPVQAGNPRHMLLAVALVLAVTLPPYHLLLLLLIAKCTVLRLSLLPDTSSVTHGWLVARRRAT